MRSIRPANASSPSSTPAASNFQLLMEVIINEVLTHTDDPLEDALELYNPWPTNVNIGNYWISNARNDPKKFRIPAGTMHSFSANNNKIIWTLTVKGEISRWPDVDESFDVTVGPA